MPIVKIHSWAICEDLVEACGFKFIEEKNGAKYYALDIEIQFPESFERLAIEPRVVIGEDKGGWAYCNERNGGFWINRRIQTLKDLMQAVAEKSHYVGDIERKFEIRKSLGV